MFVFSTFQQWGHRPQPLRNSVKSFHSKHNLLANSYAMMFGATAFHCFSRILPNKCQGGIRVSPSSILGNRHKKGWEPLF